MSWLKEEHVFSLNWRHNFDLVEVVLELPFLGHVFTCLQVLRLGDPRQGALG